MTARFDVHRVFHLTGTGPVVSGRILEGTVRAGMLATLDERPEHGPWTIASVGVAKNTARGKTYVLLKFPPVPLVDELRALIPPGSVLTISEPDPQ
jgi:hypothetical protein